MQRLLKGIFYIEAHLGEALTLDQIAVAAHLSPHHFARSFRATSGDTVMGYVRKRRLSIAAERLARNECAIIDIAFDASFDSQEAFTRAFKRQFGITPAAFREKQKADWVRYRRAITGDTLAQLKDITRMDPIIKTYPAIKAIGLAQTFDQDTRHGIPALWDKLIPQMGAVPNMTDGTTYGLCKGTGGDGAFTYMAGVEVTSLDDVPDGMEGWEIPEQKYAVFTHTLGSENIHEDIQPTVQYIWGSWAETSGHTIANAPDFERYGPDFRPGQGQVIEFFIPIE